MATDELGQFFADVHGAFKDAIGDRLDHPENVPAELAHLIPDDMQRVKRILEFPVSGRVLDVGCSDGAITRRIAEKWGVVAWAADIRAADCDCGLTWDVREPWPHITTKLFDAVYACEVFEHLTDADADKALQNILAVLKPVGDLIVTVPNRHPDDIYEVGCRSRWAWPDHRSSYTLEKLGDWLAPHFAVLDFVPLYNERIADSIWLIVRAKHKQQ